MGTNLDRITIWVAEGETYDGNPMEVIFNSPPSTSDVLNACEDIESDIAVYSVDCIVVDSKLFETIEKK